MDRVEVWRKMQARKLSGTDAAKLLGISRQRVSQLFHKWLKKQERGPSVPQEKPVRSNASIVPDAVPRQTGPDPLAEIFGPGGQAPEDLAPAAPPVNMKEVLNPIGQTVDNPPHSSPDTGADPGTTSPPPDPSPRPAAPEVDPEDASAGRELLRWARRVIVEGAAKFFGMKETDPGYATLKEENEFLRVSLKRNSEKAAPLGWLTKSWWGLAIGAGIEFVRVAYMAPKSDVPAKPTQFRVVPKNDPPAPDPAPETMAAPPADEDDAPKRPTLAEKIERGLK